MSTNVPPMSEPTEPNSGWAPPPPPAGGQIPTLPPASPSPSAPAAPSPWQQQPTSAWQQPSPTGWSGGDNTKPMVPLGGAPTESGAPKRSRGKTIGALVGVGALIAAGGFAVVTITGNDSAGGAASPSEVGTALTTALDNEDMLGVIDLLLPGEREAFREPLIQTLDNLRRLEVVSDDASLRKIGGIDIQLTDVTVDEQPTNVSDIVNLEISGSATVSVNGDEVPLGGLLIDEAFDGERPDLDAEPESEEFNDVPLTVVERDGRWYLSAFYSAAEASRRDLDDDLDIPEVGVVAEGAGSPEGAVDDMLEAISDQNLERMIALLDPNEAEALQRYAPLFLDDAQEEFDAAGINWSISDTTFAVEGSGSRRFVAVETFSFSGTDGDSDISADFADGCLTVDIDGDETEVCTSDYGRIDEMFGASIGEVTPAVTDLISTIQAAFEDFDASGIAVHEVGGSWYVSPLRSYTTLMNDILDALDTGEVRDIAAGVRAVADEIFGGFEDDFSEEEVVIEDFPVDTIPVDDPTFDTVPDDTAVDEFAALNECYSEFEAAAALTCMRDGIAAGTIDPTFVPATFRFPECGVSEAYWDGMYEMADAEFVALIEAAAPCFRALVDAGTIESWDVPDELFAPGCLEGRNWYSTDDEAYTERFFECAAKRREETIGV